MRTAMILCTLFLASACVAKGGQTDTPSYSERVELETTPIESVTKAPVEEAEPQQAEPAAIAEEPIVAEPSNEPATAVKKRYRRGGGKVRRGDRALELRAVINGAGKRVTLESHKAPILVLTFGASWCAPCKKELPALEKLARGYSPAQVAFVAVNIDSTLATGKAFMKRSGLKRVQAVYDPKSTNVQSYDPPTMPSVFIVNEGIVKHLHAGFHSGDERKLKKAIDKELN
jgi:thiol-disulfide isomerase/thioredoxin